MEICRGCGAFVMEGWDRCKICGHDPMAVLAPAEPEGKARRKKASPKKASPKKAGPDTPRPDTPRPDKPRADKAGAGRAAWAGLAVLALGAAGYILWYRPAQETDSASADGGRATATDGAAVDPAAPVDTTPATQPAPTATTAAPGGGSPGRMRDDFAAAIGGLGAATFPLPGDAWPCAGRLVVDALGGADALAAQGLAPADFANGAVEGRLVVPSGAIDLVAAGLASCGIDMVDLVVRQIAATNDAEIVACISAGLDHGIANRALATQLATGAEAMVPGNEFYDHLLAVAADCDLG
jgi:hypothetical protein